VAGVVATWLGAEDDVGADEAAAVASAAGFPWPPHPARASTAITPVAMRTFKANPLPNNGTGSLGDHPAMVTE